MMRKIGILVACVCALSSALAAAQENLVKDAGFDAYSIDKPGGWEVRYGHKGELAKEPTTFPKWKVESKKDESADRGNYVELVKDGAAAGTIIVGQRVTLPATISSVELTVDYQAYCQLDDRSGMVGLFVYKPETWDRIAKDPAEVKGGAPSGDVFAEWVKKQGADQTEWATAKADAAKATAGIKRFAGKEVVVAVAYTAWHATNKEYARYDNLRLVVGK